MTSDVLKHEFSELRPCVGHSHFKRTDLEHRLIETHSPDIVRGFPLDALVHMPGPGSILALASVPSQAKQHCRSARTG